LTIVMLVAVPVGVAVMALTAIAFALIMQVTGVPTGTLGAILGIGWLVGSLVLAGIAMRRVYRAMPGSIRWILTDRYKRPAATEPVTRSEASPPTGETRSRP
jgi:hypothetical protein